MRRLKMTEVQGSLSDFARDGLREPVVVTKRGKPVVAVVPLTRYDDWESVALSTSPRFLEIIERSRASARRSGTLSLEDVRSKYGLRARSPHRRSRKSR